MKCSVDGCSGIVRYKTAALCQKHYFRVRRNGTVEKIRVAGYRTHNKAGYQMLREPNHPLAMANGLVYEHRMVAYDAGIMNGSCSMCGAHITWETCHIDHINKDVSDNRVENIRTTCRSCNTFRDYPDQHTIGGCYAVTIGGVSMTPEEWSREAGVIVSGSCIRGRLSRGFSDYDSVYSPKKTHKK